MRTIHRASLSGRTVCGKAGLTSCTGLLVTCPDCLEATRPMTKEEALKAIQAAAANFRAARA